MHGVVGIGGIVLDLAVFGFELGLERAAARHRVERQSGVGCQRALGVGAGQFDELGRLRAVAAHELRLQPELFHLLDHGRGLRIHAAEEHQVGGLALDGSENRHEVGRAVGRVFARHHFAAGGLGRLLHFVGQALPIGRAVVDDGDFLRTQLGHREIAQHAALLRVVGHHTICRLETGCRVGHRGGRG